MLWSYSAFKKEVVAERDMDECSGCCDDIDNEEAVSELLETVEADIMESEEVKFTNT
jgi:hypothetical protein